MKEVLARFWTVNSPIGPGEARYASREEALQVACSLAKLHMEKEFYVMQSVSVSYVQIPPAETRNYALC